MSKRRMSDQGGEEASNSRERKLPRRNPNLQQEAPIPANPNQAPIQAQDLLFEKTLTFKEATGNQLLITGARHKASLMAFLIDAERDILATNGGLKVPTRDVNGVVYELELKRNSMTYFNGWGPLARANQVSAGDSVEGFGYRAAGEFRLNLNIIRKTRMSDDHQHQVQAPIPAQALLFEKMLSYSEATCGQRELSIKKAHGATLMAFLTDAERQEAQKEDGIGLMVPSKIANGNGVEYALELKRNNSTKETYFNGWQEVARANQLNTGDLLQGFGYRAAGMFRLNLDIIRN